MRLDHLLSKESHRLVRVLGPCGVRVSFHVDRIVVVLALWGWWGGCGWVERNNPQSGVEASARCWVLRGHLLWMVVLVGLLLLARVV